MCPAIAAGSPLRWLAAYHGSLIVNRVAMLKDLLQYTVLSEAALCGLWLCVRAREESSRSRAPAEAIIGSALGALSLSAVTGGFPLTWVTAGQYAPAYSLSAMQADAALWTLVALCGWLAGRTLLRSPGGRRGAVEPVRPAGDGA